MSHKLRNCVPQFQVRSHGSHSSFEGVATTQIPFAGVPRRCVALAGALGVQRRQELPHRRFSKQVAQRADVAAKPWGGLRCLNLFPHGWFLLEALFQTFQRLSLIWDILMCNCIPNSNALRAQDSINARQVIVESNLNKSPGSYTLLTTPSLPPCYKRSCPFNNLWAMGLLL